MACRGNRPNVNPMEDEAKDEPRTPDLPEAEEPSNEPAPRRLVMSREVRGWIAGLSALAVALAAVAPGISFSDATGSLGSLDPKNLTTAADDPCDAGEALCKTVAGAGYIEVEHNAPDTVFAGETSSIMFEFTTTAPLGSLFQVSALVQASSEPFCTITNPTSSGGVAVREGEFMVFSDIAARLQPLVPTKPAVDVDVMGGPSDGLVGTGQIGGTPALDLGEILPSTVRIDLQLNFHPQAIDQQCKLAVDVLETFPQLTPTLTQALRPVIDIIEYIPVAISMGSVKTTGGPWEEDTAAVVLPALPDVSVFSLTGSIKVPLLGAIDHQDGSDYEDYGRFWITVDDVQTGKSVKVSEPKESLAILVLHEFAAGTNGVARDYEVCLHAKYVDGGAYKDVEGRAHTCSKFHVLKVAELPAKATGLVEGGAVGDLVYLPLFAFAPIPALPTPLPTR